MNSGRKVEPTAATHERSGMSMRAVLQTTALADALERMIQSLPEIDRVDKEMQVMRAEGIACR